MFVSQKSGVLILGVAAIALVGCGSGSAVDPCTDVTCSGVGRCVAAGTPPIASCECNDGYRPVELSCVVSVFDLGFTASFNKVFFEAPTEFQGSLGNQTHIFLAQNEYEAIQMVLFPTQDLPATTVEVSDLVGPAGSIVAADMEIHVVGYVNLLAAKVDGDRIGWHPDPLLPNQAIDLTREVLQPYLITVHSRETTSAGTYTGTITVRSSGVAIGTARLAATVWNVALPRVPRFKSGHLGSWSLPGNMWPGSSFTDEERRAHMLEIADLGFRNRLAPTFFLANGLSSWNWNGTGGTNYGYPTHDGTTFNAQRTDELIDYLLAKGGNHFFIGLTSDIFEYPALLDGRHARLVAYLRDYRQHLSARGLLGMAYVYNVDEPWGAAVQHARDTYALLKTEVGSDLRIMQNTNQNNATIIGTFLGSFDALDINLGHYDIMNTDAYRQSNPAPLADLWWNVNIWPDVHPNLFLEYPLVDARIIGPMSYKYRIKGFEYWDLLAKGSIGNYYVLPTDALRVDWRVDNRSLDGALVYPGTEFRIFSSMRYESLRDGFEDQELLYLLADADPTNPLVEVPVVTGLGNFEHDQDAYLQFREQIGAALDAR